MSSKTINPDMIQAMKNYALAKKTEHSIKDYIFEYGGGTYSFNAGMDGTFTLHVDKNGKISVLVHPDGSRLRIK